MGIGALKSEPRVFYRPRRKKERQPRKNSRHVSSQGQLEGILASLTSLGLQGVTEGKVAEAVSELFPEGTNGIDDGDVIRAIYRHLRQSEVV